MINLGNICQYNPDLILLGDILVLVVGVWTDAAGLSLNDRDLHVLDLYTNQQEVNLPNDHILCTIVKLHLWVNQDIGQKPIDTTRLIHFCFRFRTLLECIIQEQTVREVLDI